MTYNQYKRSAIAELAEWDGIALDDSVSVSAEDIKNGSPLLGDMIARNPSNHKDKWLVARAYFADNFDPI